MPQFPPVYHVDDGNGACLRALCKAPGAPVSCSVFPVVTSFRCGCFITMVMIT